MKKQTSTLAAMIPQGTSIHEFITSQGKLFDQRFGSIMPEVVAITLIFDSLQDAHEFYNEVRYSSKYQTLYTIKTDRYNPLQLHVSGSETLYDYFGTREPNLLTVSRVLGLSYKVEYVQPMSGIVFNGEVVQGELLGRQCIIEVSNIIPELALGGLRYIARDLDQFDALLTRLYAVEGQRIL